MRRLLALPVLAAALALPAPAHASQDFCTPTNQIGACVHYVCVDICGPEVTVGTYCGHPFPESWCSLLPLREEG
jgi:hypothetical protein